MNQEERIKALEAEIDRLTDSLEEEKETVAALTEPDRPILKRIVELEVEAVRLREDKARLDTAEKLKHLMPRYCNVKTVDGEPTWGDCWMYGNGEYDTFREAIDAARNGKRG